MRSSFSVYCLIYKTHILILQQTSLPDCRCKKIASIRTCTFPLSLSSCCRTSLLSSVLYLIIPCNNFLNPGIFSVQLYRNQGTSCIGQRLRPTDDTDTENSKYSKIPILRPPMEVAFRPLLNSPDDSPLLEDYLVEHDRRNKLDLEN